MNAGVFVVLFLGSILVAILLARRSRNPALHLAKGETLLEKGQREAARKPLERALSLTKSGRGKEADRSRILGRASLLLGQIDEAAGMPSAAFEHYVEARKAGTHLPAPAIRLMAERYAEKGTTGDDVMFLYLAYIGLPAPHSDKVLTVLSNVCRVTEDMKPAERKAAADLNRRVISVDPGIEWAHYYYGLASFLDGRIVEALEELNRARALSEERPLTFYWLGVCHLQQAEPNVEAAIAAIDRYLAFPEAGGKSRKREARACNELGKRLAARVGGFETTESCSSGERHTTLTRAIHYLEMATARHSDPPYWFDLGRAYSLSGATASAIGALENAANGAPREKTYLYRLAVEKNRVGDHAGAQAALQQAIEIDNKYVEAQVLLGQILLDQGRFGAAEQHFRKALKQRKQDGACIALLVRSLYGQGKHEEVASQADNLPPSVLSAKTQPEAVFLVARSYARAGRFADAARWLENLGHERRALYYLGCAQANNQQLTEARASFEALTAGGDEFATRALVQRGHVLLAQGERAEAQKSYLAAVERDGPGAGALYGLGALAYEAEDYSTAVSWFVRALSAEPANSQTRFALGAALERQGQIPAARTTYAAIPVDAPCGVAAALRAGVLSCRLGHYPEALDCFEKCAAAGDDSDAFLLYRGTAQVLSGRLEEGMADWSRLHERHPDNERLALNQTRAQYMLGAREITAGNYKAALTAWEQYLERYPADEKTARDLAELHFRAALAELDREGGPDAAKAAEHLRQAVARDPANPTYSYYLALSELRIGNHRACAEALSRLMETGGRQPRLVYHLGLCLIHAGKSEEAARLLAEVKSDANGNGYGRYAAWAIANEHLRQGQMELAAAELAPVATAALAEAARSGM